MRRVLSAMLAVGAVALTPTAMAADANREPTQDTPSVHTKTEIDAKPIGEEIVHGKVGYQLWENSEFSFVFPLLSRHPDPEKAKAYLFPDSESSRRQPQ